MNDRIDRIVDYQDRQYTVKEALERCMEDIEDRKYDHVIILYRKDNEAGWSIGADNRSYLNNEIWWDVSQFMKSFI